MDEAVRADWGRTDMDLTSMGGTRASPGRPTEVVVDLTRIEDNAAFLRALLQPGQRLMAVVKADGYGHGAVPVAEAALRGGASWLGVAVSEEGVALRNAGINVPILVLGPSHASQICQAVAYDLDLTIFDHAQLEVLAHAARAHQTRARVHLKLDTGMGRVGLQSDQLDARWVNALRGPDLSWVGISTHFAASDDDDPEPTRRQLSRFLDALEQLRWQGALPPEIHAANSAAVLKYPGTHFTLVRAGLALYGLKPFDSVDGLKPSLAWYSEVVYLKTVPAGFHVGYGGSYTTDRPQQLAAVPVGYADGYRRIWSNRSHVLIRGRRYPVVGRVSMDQITVAVPTEDPVNVGDRVTLLGSDGDGAVPAEELAFLMDSIAYEVVTGVSQRVRRRYRSD